MQNDDVIWSIINRSFCSFKISTSSQNFCREPNNVSGLCSRSSCPLANSQYATVREEKGILYLYIKTAERHYFPVKQWEKIKLSRNFKRALRQIDENLILYKKYFRQKCRQRLLKITQTLSRMRQQTLEPEKKLIPIRRKIDLRYTRREQKALVAAKTDLAIEKKLLERLKEGVYGGIYNFCPTAFEEVTKEAEVEKEMEGYKVVGDQEEVKDEATKQKKKIMKIMDKEIEQEEEEEEDEEVEEREYIADLEESEDEEDIEDLDIESQYIRYLRDNDYDVDEDEHDEGDERADDSDDDEESQSSPAAKKRKLNETSSKSKLNNISKVKKLLKKPKVKIEYEEEEEEPVMQRQKMKVRA